MHPPIIGQGSRRDPRALALETRAGKWIENNQEDPLPPVQMRAMIRTHRHDHPNILLRSAASTYNCTGMVFANRRTAINIELTPRILDEDDYRQIRREDARVGDLVLYFNGDDRVAHVGLIASVPPEHDLELGVTRVLSQWGYHGEYLHALTDVPSIYGDPLEFWTDRIPTP